MSQRFLQIAVVYLFLTGHESMIQVAIVSSIVVLVGLGLFALNVLTNVKAASKP